MRLLYYKYQWACILIALGFLTASIFYYIQAKNLEAKPTTSYLVTAQYCHSYQKQSSIQVDYKGNNYTIRVKEGECRDYPIGSHIQLVYNNKYDYFYRPDGLKGPTAKVKIMIFLFLFTLAPLKYIEKRLKNR